MNPNDPRHGTNAGAMQHWKDGEVACGPCARAHTKARTLREIDPDPRLVPLGEKAWRILHETPRAELARRTGMQVSHLCRIMNNGPEGKLNRVTRERILAAETWTLVGIQRRLQALAAIGWSAAEVARRAGLSERTINQVRLGHGAFFRSAARPILAVYDELHMAPAPRGTKSSSGTLTRARRYGWAPPMAWDDIDRDPAPSGMRRRDDRQTRHVTAAHEDQRPCGRCGVVRQVNTKRGDLCRDCWSLVREEAA